MLPLSVLSVALCGRADPALAHGTLKDILLALQVMGGTECADLHLKCGFVDSISAWGNIHRRDCARERATSRLGM